MPTSKFLVTRIPANRAQILITSGVALALFLVFGVALFERRQLVYLGITYIPFSSALLIMTDWITAALLLAQAKALRALPLAVLAAGFSFAGLFVILRLVSVPSFVTPDPTYQVPLLFYLASHAALPLAVIPYIWLGGASRQSAGSATLGRPAQRSLAGAVILAGSVILAGTAVETSLQWTSPVFLAGTFVLLLTITAMVLLGLNLRSEMGLWLLLTLWGWLLEVALITLESRGNTFGWYAARGMGLVSGLFVLFMLIKESSRLYGQSVHELVDQEQERERRFLIREAIGASLAHEMRQPITAMLLNAKVAQRYQDSQIADMRAAINDILESGHRAQDIMQSSRAMLGGEARDRIPVDLEALVRSTLKIVARKTRARNISVSIVVEGTLKQVRVDAVQIQQALLNLFENAIGALTHVEGRDRTLEVRCIAGPGEDGLTIRVEDNGPGIDPVTRKKLFTPFFTTRRHGTGLGLMIASFVVETHSGKISVEPRSPFGTTFVIWLPIGGASVSIIADNKSAPRINPAFKFADIGAALRR